MRKDRRDNYTAKVVKTTSATSTPVANTVYLYSVAIAVSNAGTTWSLAIQDKDPAGASVLYTLGTVVVTTAPLVILNLALPIRMVGGIDVITTGATPGALVVWLNYSQD